MTPDQRVFAAQLHNAVESYRRLAEHTGHSVSPMLAALGEIAGSSVRECQGESSFGDPGGLADSAVVTPRLLTYDQAADVLAVSLSTLKRLVKAGELPVVHVNGAARIRVADLDAFVERLGEPARPRLVPA